MATRMIPLKGKLADHFCSDDISADMLRNNYEASTRVLLNPAKFPRADMDTIGWLVEELFELDPTACLTGF